MTLKALTACVLFASPAIAQSTGEIAKIRRARLEQNQAMAANDAERVASYWTEDITLRRGLGHAVSGRDEYRKLVEGAASDSSVVYQRQPTSIEVSRRWPLAFETGTWTGRLGGPRGQAVIGGKYSAQWVKRDTSWLIRAEVFVALDCSGVGCRYTYLAAAPGGRSLVVADSVHVIDVLAREPMVVEHPDGTLFVSGYSDPNPKLWKSRDHGATWTRVNVGTEADGAIGNSDVDLAIAPDGTLYFAQMGFDRSVGQGTHIAMGVSKDVGATWRWTMLSRTRFADRPWVKVAADGTAHVIWNDTTGVSYAVSTDGGVTWTTPRKIHDKGGSSHLAVGPRRQVAVRVTPIAASGNALDEGVDLIAVSIDGGATWEKRAAPGERDWPSPRGNTRATPRWVEPLAWDASGRLYYFWTGRTGLWLARSKDNGVTWKTWRLAQPGDLSYFPYLTARGNGELAAAWFSGQGDAWRAHVATIHVGDGDAAPILTEATIVPEIWGLSSRRENPETRSAAGEYLPVLFLHDGSLAVVSPIQNERAGRYGFSWWRFVVRELRGDR
jgi:ketosteroid isomerase-like protein